MWFALKGLSFPFSRSKPWKASLLILRLCKARSCWSSTSPLSTDVMFRNLFLLFVIYRNLFKQLRLHHPVLWSASFVRQVQGARLGYPWLSYAFILLPSMRIFCFVSCSDNFDLPQRAISSVAKSLVQRSRLPIFASGAAVSFVSSFLLYRQ
jgi:hypothetical protein